MNNILLIGGGGHCASVADSLLRMQQYDRIGIVDSEKSRTLFDRIPVVGCDEDLASLRHDYDYAFITVGSIGNTNIREKLYKLLFTLEYKIPNVIDPSAIVSESVNLENGIFIGKKAVVNSRSYIAKQAIINTASIIEHDCKVHEFVHLSPGAVLCGNVDVGAFSHIGANSVVIQGINIGKHVIVGAGSVVLQDVESSCTVVGNPARKIIEKG